MTISKNNKLMAHLNFRVKLMLLDNRVFVGYFKAFDKHMNILLCDCEEHRKTKGKPGRKGDEVEKRQFGLVLLRGEHVISLTVDGPPVRDDDSAKLPKAGGMAGPGTAKPSGRGMGMPQAAVPPPMGLGGAVRGVGGPGMPMMQPSYGAPPPMGMMPPRPPAPGPF